MNHLCLVEVVAVGLLPIGNDETARAVQLRNRDGVLLTVPLDEGTGPLPGYGDTFCLVLKDSEVSL